MDPVAYAVSRSVENATYGVGPVNRNCTNGDPMFPNPTTCFTEMVPAALTFLYKSLPWDGLKPWMQQTWEWHYIAFHMQPLQIFHILTIALLFTSVRYFLTEYLLKRIPVWANITSEEGKQKFPEAAFRFLVYTWLWCWSCYIVVDNYFLTDLMGTVRGWSPGWPMPPSTYWLYMVELGFYVHLVYATIYVELIRKDFYVMLFHHVLTIALMCYSFGVRFHYIGVLVLFIHDFGDIWLEISKAIIYFKERNGRVYSIPENIANCTFAVFVLQWILFRLYWFPTKLLYLASYVGLCYYSDCPFYIVHNLMLWMLFFLHIYWFYFIAVLVIKVVSGKELEDNRDYEEEKESK